ncbi:hypothetical protein EDB89DRAFT_1908779 [Lactarius sanguifluus]|nr:hypothetical protein EDB89DRAFT_1908779 [Lactarius sanguifluus]
MSYRSIVGSESSSSSAIAPPCCHINGHSPIMVALPLSRGPCPMAVAGVVAALAGCWRWLVVFVQLKAALVDLRHVVVVIVGHWQCMWLGLVGDSLAMYENGNHQAGVEKVATGHGGFPRSTTTATNSPAERRHDRDGNPSSNDDNNAIDSGSGTVITRQATAVIRM